jgi:hypothetical protein
MKKNKAKIKEKLNYEWVKKDLPFLLFCKAQCYPFGGTFLHENVWYTNKIDVEMLGDYFNYPEKLDATDSK